MSAGGTKTSMKSNRMYAVLLAGVLCCCCGCAQFKTWVKPTLDNATAGDVAPAMVAAEPELLPAAEPALSEEEAAPIDGPDISGPRQRARRSHSILTMPMCTK